MNEAANQIANLRDRLTALESERARIAAQLAALEQAAMSGAQPGSATALPVTMASSTSAKIALFRDLFRGREDVFPRRWENPRTEKAGYAPACKNEWVRGVCEKPKIKCGECPNQAFIPVGDEVIRWHLSGKAPGNSSNFAAGVYPMLPDDTCWFLAIDFDKKAWKEDVAAFRETAKAKEVPVAIERSRSGNGAHAWIFARRELGSIVADAAAAGRVLGVRLPQIEDDDAPWTTSPSRQEKDIPIQGVLPASVEIVLGSRVFIDRTKLPPTLVSRLARLAAFQNPEFYAAQAMRLPTYGKPRVISCSELFSKHVALPRGCLHDALNLLRNTHIAVEIRDERVHRRQLLDQWVVRLRAFLDIPQERIGVVYGGKRRPTGLVDVALMQSLVRKGQVSDLVANYGHVVVDECHHLSAVSFEAILREVKAHYILGLSATVSRKDGHHPIIFMQCGPVRHRVDARSQARARPFEHKVVVRRTAFRLGRGEAVQKPKIQEIYAKLAGDPKRNDLIFDDILSALEAGRSPVVITERKDHLDLLVSRLVRFAKNVIAFHGGMGVRRLREANEALAAVAANEERVVVATGRYLGEGFDDARLDTLFLTMPISWCGILAQYAGRLHRLYPTKRDVLIYDYTDSSDALLAKMAKKREAGYRSLGYRTVDASELEVSPAQHQRASATNAPRD